MDLARCLQIAFFRNHQGGFLRAILDALENDFFASNQTVIDLHAEEEMFIISNGQIRVCDEHGVVIRRLLEGNAFGERALFRVVYSKNHLIADSSSELWWLPRQTFKSTVTKHSSKTKLAMIRMQRNSSRPSAVQGVDDSRVASRIDGRKASAHDFALRKLMDKIHKDAENLMKSVSAWRFPGSSFRIRWKRLRLALLLFIGIEVPYQIAFHRGFSLFQSDQWSNNSSFRETTILMIANYFVNVVIEVFFYVDWYLTAMCCVRSVYDADQSSSSSTNDSQKQLHAHELIVEKKQIFRHYTENDRFWLDFIANLPFTIIWDAVPKSSFSSSLVRWAQSLRVVRLVRLRSLLADMPGVMTELSMSRSSQLLVYVSAFCLLLAHCVGCVYYLAADLDDQVDGLPVNHAGMPVTAPECLAAVSMFGNCTWYMYDYSTYGIGSPFIRSMHWSVVLLSTVGYGDILSFSDNECFIGFWWIFFGAVICYFTASAISSVLAQWGVLNSIKNDQLQEINRTLLSLQTMSPLTATTIRRYYVLKWKLNGSCTTEDEFLRHLPKSLDREVTQALYKEELRQCVVFKTSATDSPLLREIARIVRCEIFLKGMVIMGAGILATEMFVIQSGAVELVNEEVLRFTTQPRALVHTRTGHRFSLIGALKLGDAANAPVSPDPDHVVQFPLATLRKHACFGEESLALNVAKVYYLSARAVASTQVLVIPRASFLAILGRFAKESAPVVAAIEAKMVSERQTLERVKANITIKRKKLVKLFGAVNVVAAASGSSPASSRFVIDPDHAFVTLWRSVVFFIMVYNFYQIPLRIAFLPEISRPLTDSLTAIDILCDVVLYVDVYLKWNQFGYKDNASGKITDRASIRTHYMRGQLKIDVLSMLPTYFGQGHPFARALSRLFRLLKSPQLLGDLEESEEEIQEHFLSGSTTLLSVFDMVKFFAFFLSAAHQVGSIYYLFGRLQIEYGVASVSWITADLVLGSNPNDPLANYVRAIYWCLETVSS